MRIRYELSNYRCFPDDHPARLVIRPGFTSFIGINNAGKSTVLRSLYELRPLFAELSGSGSNRYLGSAGNVNVQGPSDPREIFSDTTDRDLRLVVELEDAEQESEIPVPERLSFVINRDRAMHITVHIAGNEYVPNSWVSHGAFNVLELNPSTLVDVRPYLAAFALLNDTVYIGAFRNALNVAPGEPYYDLAVGQSFIAQWDEFKAGGMKERRRAALRVESELARIFELDSVQLNSSSDRKTLIVAIGAESYALQDLGAGLAQFIIVLAFSATRTPAVILIDEPELNLHPALQLDFLNTLGSFASHGVLFATHSIGLARAASDAVYSLRRIDQGVADMRPFEATPAMSEFLGELSLSGYQELGFSTVLLVEGPTELRTVQGLLRHYRLEHKVVLLPLGGGSMIRPGVAEPLREIKRLTSSVYALIDSERAAADAPLDRERAGFQASCAEAEVDCHVLKLRALENYFPDRAIKAALDDSYGALEPYESLGASVKPWSKAKDNWKIGGSRRRCATAERRYAGVSGCFVA